MAVTLAATTAWTTNNTPWASSNTATITFDPPAPANTHILIIVGTTSIQPVTATDDHDTPYTQLYASSMTAGLFVIVSTAVLDAPVSDVTLHRPAAHTGITYLEAFALRGVSTRTNISVAPAYASTTQQHTGAPLIPTTKGEMVIGAISGSGGTYTNVAPPFVAVSDTTLAGERGMIGIVSDATIGVPTAMTVTTPQNENSALVTLAIPAAALLDVNSALYSYLRSLYGTHITDLGTLLSTHFATVPGTDTTAKFQQAIVAARAYVSGE